MKDDQDKQAAPQATAVRAPSPQWLIGVDGGGSGTRVVIARPSVTNAPPVVLARAQAGPSGLTLGVERAWAAIHQAAAAALGSLGAPLDWSTCVLGAGLAGVNHAASRERFLHLAPTGLQGLSLDSDAVTTLIGAHQGAPGIVVALGTGSVSMALHTDQRTQIIGGWGFPSGDEASGAWLGLQAIRHAQKAVDGRVAEDAFAQALLLAAGLSLTGSADARRHALQAWLIGASQTDFATLAPAVAAHAAHPVAAALWRQAAVDVGDMVRALDPAGTLPVALCGSLGSVVSAGLEEALSVRLVAAREDAAFGALMLAANFIR